VLLRGLACLPFGERGAFRLQSFWLCHVLLQRKGVRAFYAASKL
jgi:hypothetical protein